MTVDDRQQRLLDEFLAERDVPCPACGYNLRQLTASRCPECGEELRLQIACAEPKMVAGIAGVIGLAAGAGLNGLLVIFILIRTVFLHDGGPDETRFWVVILSGFLVEGSALLLFLKFWKKIRQLDSGPKSLVVIGCWALTIVDVIIFSIFIK